MNFTNFKNYFFTFLFSLLSFFTIGQNLKLTTSSDSCLLYYQKGWVQIMDYGNYSKAEKLYRKAVKFDPNFLIGWSLVGRISDNETERLKIIKKIDTRKHLLNPDEQLLIEVYYELIKLMNYRSNKDIDNAERQSKIALKIGELNLRNIVRKYPNETYYKYEYIEILQSNLGTQTALDSLYVLTSSEQQKLPLFLGYAASLESKLKNYDKAIALATELKNSFPSKTSPKPYIVLADILFNKGNLQKAFEEAKKAVDLDSNNLEATRLYNRIEFLLKEE